MNILIIIPARGGSKGLEEKNTKPLAGTPLIGYTIEAALESELADKTVVSTDDKLIGTVSRSYGIQVIDRPAEYSTDTAPIEWALRHAVRYLEESENYSADIVVWLQANVPIRKKGQIDAVIKKLINTKADSVITVTEVTQRPEHVMKMINGNRVIQLARGKEIRRQDFRPLYIADGAVLAMRTDVLMRTEGMTGAHVYLGEDIRGVAEEPEYAIEIDNQFDFDVAEGLLLNRRKTS
ncbi:MAG: acylneuraminate cytidylyltransferase family protein [Deltaproteobacteria bacterium]|nr:acylneuraminate cytidylyltransferase family protein [Deltaproteobacteria bacterium]